MWAAVKLAMMRLLTCLLLLGLVASVRAGAEEAPAPWRLLSVADEAPLGVPQLLGAQGTFIIQRLLPFSAPYSGPLSLVTGGDVHSTRTLGAYFGLGLTPRLQVYLDLENFTGNAVSRATGMGGLTNADVIRQGSGDLGQGPYVARRYLRYLVPLGGDAPVRAERGQDQLPGLEPASRLEFKAGTFAVGDDFDRNRYANTARTQFLNWSFFNNLAWDYAADTRGYTDGLLAAWVTPAQALRLGVFKMPSVANGQDLDTLSKARGTNLEWTLHPGPWDTVLRVLGYHNRANMGDYGHALAIAEPGTVPSIAADDRPGRVKYGFGLNVEQPLADDGETGLFGRLGWNNGRTESFAYTEADRHASLGVQVAGTRWGRPADRLGLAVAANGLSEPHRRYLEAGGLGFVLGDGRLRYAPEELVEAYYRVALGPAVSIGPDLQYGSHPGYNSDRGPAWVVGLRLHAEY